MTSDAQRLLNCLQNIAYELLQTNDDLARIAEQCKLPEATVIQLQHRSARIHSIYKALKGN